MVFARLIGKQDLNLAIKMYKPANSASKAEDENARVRELLAHLRHPDGHCQFSVLLMLPLISKRMSYEAFLGLSCDKARD